MAVLGVRIGGLPDHGHEGLSMVVLDAGIDGHLRLGAVGTEVV